MSPDATELYAEAFACEVLSAAATVAKDADALVLPGVLGCPIFISGVAETTLFTAARGNGCFDVVSPRRSS